MIISHRAVFCQRSERNGRKGERGGVHRIPDGNAQNEQKCADEEGAAERLRVFEEDEAPQPRVDDKPRKAAPEGDAPHRVHLREDDGGGAVGDEPQNAADERLIPIPAPLQKADDALLAHEEEQEPEHEVDEQHERRHLQCVQQGGNEVERQIALLSVLVFAGGELVPRTGAVFVCVRVLMRVFVFVSVRMAPVLPFAVMPPFGMVVLLIVDDGHGYQ